MTREEAIQELQLGHVICSDKYGEAVDMAIKSIEAIGHLKDRPCSVCEFHKENGCCKWNCVFDEVLR